MKDNLEPIATRLRDACIRRGRSDKRRRPPTRDLFQRLARRYDSRLAQDFDDLYYECHRLFIIEVWKHSHWPYEVSAEKMQQIIASYSADTYPKLRGVIEHRGCYWFIAAIMYLGDTHPPLAKAYHISPYTDELAAATHGDGFYVGSTITHRGFKYIVSSRTAVFFSHKHTDEPHAQQEDLF